MTPKQRRKEAQELLNARLKAVPKASQYDCALAAIETALAMRDEAVEGAIRIVLYGAPEAPLALRRRLAKSIRALPVAREIVARCEATSHTPE